MVEEPVVTALRTAGEAGRRQEQQGHGRQQGEEEAEYCHRLALMYRGRVIALGSPAELKAEHGPGSTMDDVFVTSIEREEHARLEARP